MEQRLFEVLTCVHNRRNANALDEDKGFTHKEYLRVANIYGVFETQLCMSVNLWMWSTECGDAY